MWIHADVTGGAIATHFRVVRYNPNSQRLVDKAVVRSEKLANSIARHIPNATVERVFWVKDA